MNASFAADCDRGNDREPPPTRDLLVEAARERYRDVFADTTAVPTDAETTA